MHHFRNSSEQQHGILISSHNYANAKTFCQQQFLTIVFEPEHNLFEFIIIEISSFFLVCKYIISKQKHYLFKFFFFLFSAFFFL